MLLMRCTAALPSASRTFESEAAEGDTEQVRVQTCNHLHWQVAVAQHCTSHHAPLRHIRVTRQRSVREVGSREVGAAETSVCGGGHTRQHAVALAFNTCHLCAV